MSSTKCFKEGCINKLYGKCECEGVVLFCKKHALKHLKTETSKRHKCLRLYFQPKEEIKQPIIDMLTELKKDIKILKVDAIANANEIIKSFKAGFGKYIDQINEVEARCNKMIEILNSGEKVLDIATEDDIESVLKFNSTDIENMFGWDIKENYLDFKEIKTAINNIFKVSFRIETICLNELSFFRSGSQNFASIDLNTLQISSTVTLPIQESIHIHTTSCILPDKTYFYCCNGNTSSGYTFTVEEDKNVKQLQNSKVNYYAEPIFYNNFIYLIGGNNKLAERYDFKRNIWESMAPIAQNLNFASSCNVLYRDLILITSYYMPKIVIYSIPQNNYQEVQNLVLKASINKLMLTANNRIYVFEKSERTFESAENNISNWTQIGNNTITNSYNQSSVVRFKGCLFFLSTNSELWKFDLSSKQASKVTTF